MSLGKGMPVNTSTKQKINTRSSTETELAAPTTLCLSFSDHYFLEAQGYGHQDNLYQDNQSAILPRKEWSQVQQQTNQTSELSIPLHRPHQQQ
jgi:hypothetical protein